MLRHVEAEDFLLQPQQLALLELLRADRDVLELLLLAEERALPEQTVRLRPCPARQGRLQRIEHSLPRCTGRVQRTALHQRLERALVRGLRIDALAELPDRAEAAALLPRADDRARCGLPDI